MSNCDYNYGINTQGIEEIKFDKGINEEVIKRISEIKGEEKWLLDFRLKSYKAFTDIKNPKWGPDLSNIDFKDIHYYIRKNNGVKNSWEDVNAEIRNTFDEIGIMKAEKEHLSGVATQYESEMVYHNMDLELKEKGVIFSDTDSAIKKYPDLFRKYFSTLIPYTDNKYAALNSAVFSGGSFIYIPKGVIIEKPLHSYFKIDSKEMGQFERTLIILEEGAHLHYIEGCTAPTHSSDSFHAGVVEIFIGKNATCRYTTLQNWSNNVYNLVTKRAIVSEGGKMEWVDGNLGSKLNMKYPAIILKGDNSVGTTISIAVAGENQIQDTGSKMIHIGKNTKSRIISKSIAKNGGKANYRGVIVHDKNAINARSNIECDTLILDDKSKSDTIPLNYIENGTSTLEHEARVSKIDEKTLYYLMSRGIKKEEANEMIVLGFIEPFTRELPMEYAVELNRLLKMSMEGSTF